MLTSVLISRGSLSRNANKPVALLYICHPWFNPSWCVWTGSRTAESLLSFKIITGCRESTTQREKRVTIFPLHQPQLGIIVAVDSFGVKSCPRASRVSQRLISSSLCLNISLFFSDRRSVFICRSSKSLLNVTRTGLMVFWRAFASSFVQF